jgi:polyphosphate glucokinase
MKSLPKGSRGILVVDVGGSHVKCHLAERKKPLKFKSGPRLTPEHMVKKILKITERWHFHALSIGYPGVVQAGEITAEPHNLGRGWIGFDFRAAFHRPVRLINDAAMQAFGAYEGGRMLFLGLGTGLGSALVIDGVIVPMELGHLPYRHGRNYEDHVGERARKRYGVKQWRRNVDQVLEDLRQAFLPDYVVLGGGNASRLKRLPPQTRRGGNADAITGGLRLWRGRAPRSARRQTARRES